MTNMRYKDFVFPCNPARLEISQRANLAQHRCPGLGTAVQHMGGGGRTVRGSGCFFGPQAAAQYRALEAVFRQKTPGLLSLPTLPAMKAYFSALSLLAQGGGDIYEYSFEFTEEMQP